MKILITGATGFVGRPLARRLARENVEMRLLVRDPEGLPADLASRAEVLTGKVEDRDTVCRAAAGVSAIFHAAALVASWRRDPRDFDRINVDGLRNALAAADEHGVEKFIYTSSFLALDESTRNYG